MDNIIKKHSEMLETMSHNTDDFFFVMDIQSDMYHFFGNVARNYAISKFGTTQELVDIVHPKDQDLFRKQLQAVSQGETKGLNLDCRWINKNGEAIWVKCRGEVVREPDDTSTIMVGSVSEEALRHLFRPMTGLWNKFKMQQDVDALLKANCGSVFLLDIDGLAGINLTRGRDYGDRLLKEIAVFLEGMPCITHLYNIDYNNFLAFLDTKERSQIQQVFETVQNAWKGKCTFSAGSVPVDSDVFLDGASMIDAVNFTLKRAKKKGNTLEFFSLDEIHQRIIALNLLEELQRSVQNDFAGFHLVYQPQVMSGNYKLCGVEALLRYQSATRGAVFPDEFIPILEQSRLIHKVGLWVLKEALTQCKKWRTVLPELRVSVNFSAVQFEDKFIAENIVAILKELELPGDALLVEMTESVELHSDVHFNNRMKYLKAYGVRFAIDDFGTGYSSLAYLKQFIVDEIKIDRMFVTGVEKNTYNYNLISNVIAFAKDNNIVVCCEGVETTQELAILESLNPDKLQGYLFDKPLTPTAVEEIYLCPESAQYQNHRAFIRDIYAYRKEIGEVNFDPVDILRVNEVGLWVIRISKKEDVYELYADATMEKILAVEHKYTPQECYVYWLSRIRPDYLDYVYANVEKMITMEKAVQLEYPWNHPVLGEVMVRCSGRRVKNADGMVVLEGYHRIISNLEGI